MLSRPEVRDVLAWLRLLEDPQDAAAVVRALARPPIDLRQGELARVVWVARRRRLDLVVGLAAASESPQVPPEARERIARFAELHRNAQAELARLPLDAFLEQLVERLRAAGGVGASLLEPAAAAAGQEAVESLLSIAGEFVRATPQAGVRELVRHLTTVLPEPERAEDVEAAEGEQSTGTRLQEALGRLREELLGGVARIGGRLGELRLDTDLDISHGVVRYLELLKVSALMQRPEGQDLGEALADINGRLLAAVTPLQREILQTSTLDDALREIDEFGGSPPIGFREEHSLVPFLPRRGTGLALSASDIETYRSCPLRYKFARVLRIPSEQTPNQRFGIVVHQVLERFHGGGASSLAELMELLDASWRRAGFDREGLDGEMFQKARDALVRYHERLQEQSSQPVWFERPFSFRIGPHHLRGRVDRVDRLRAAAAGGEGEGEDGGEVGYELIDYKTSRPKSAEALREDVQLSLYALAAREDWQLESSCQSYYYVLDDVKVPLPRDERASDAVAGLVLEVGEGILAQEFEPAPSAAACSICDYRIVCPVAVA
jgi:RecB family exonuclease